jgi:hypothetical protein
MIRGLRASWSINMATKHSSKPNVPVDASAGYEKRDANVKGLLQFAFWMAVVLLVTMVGMRFAFDSFKTNQPLGATASPMVKLTDRMLPPSPRLQVLPHQELVDYCAAQQQEVNTYAWVNQPSGVVRIPVDRAMELILSRGLPTRSAGDAAASGSSTAVTAATVAGETDVQGQCGYLAEPTLADIERAEEAAKAKE